MLRAETGAKGAGPGAPPSRGRPRAPCARGGGCACSERGQVWRGDPPAQPTGGRSDLWAARACGGKRSPH